MVTALDAADALPPGTDAAAADAETARSPLREAFGLLFASGVGRAGLAMFAVLIGISAWVLLTYPADFGTDRWSDPTVWADNPRAAPPVWTTWLGNESLAHQTFERTEPSATRPIPAGEVRDYDIPLDLPGDTFPDALSVTVSDLTYSARPPVITATLIRPDGTTVPLANLVAPGPRPGEVAPFRRFAAPPERLLLTSQPTAAQAIARTYAERYPGLAIPTDLGATLNRALFGVPSPTGDGTIAALPGPYTLRVSLIVADPADRLESLSVVLGGTVFGLMGTDTLGRDLWEGLLYGFPVALLIASLSSIAATAIGASLGILSGYAGGVTDAVIQRLSDIVSNVPTLPLLIFLVFVLGANLWLIILVLVAFSWPGLTIVVRSMVLQVRSGQLVESARALGASRRRIMLRHVFPQVAPFIVAQMIFFAPGAILAEASLSFLGLGDTTIPTWGQMLQAGFQTGALYVGYWWWVIPPGVLIIVTALAFMLLALAMEPIVDPRLRDPS